MRKLNTLLLATAAPLALGYENESGWKMDGDKIATDSAGNPLYIDDDGREVSVKYETAVQLRGESAGYRKRAETAEAALKAFEGLDAAEARKAIDAMKDVNLDELVNKGQVEEAKEAIRKQMQADIDKQEQAAATLAAENRKLRLDNAFNSSEFLRDRVALPQDAVRATYEGRFDVKDGQVVALTPDGNTMLNKRGDPASVDEAFEMMISDRKDSDQWLRAPDASGSGSQGGGGGRTGGNVMKRSQYDALSPAEQAAVGQKLRTGEMKLAD